MYLKQHCITTNTTDDLIFSSMSVVGYELVSLAVPKVLDRYASSPVSSLKIEDQTQYKERCPVLNKINMIFFGVPAMVTKYEIPSDFEEVYKMKEGIIELNDLDHLCEVMRLPLKVKEEKPVIMNRIPHDKTPCTDLDKFEEILNICLQEFESTQYKVTNIQVSTDESNDTRLESILLEGIGEHERLQPVELVAPIKDSNNQVKMECGPVNCTVEKNLDCLISTSTGDYSFTSTIPNIVEASLDNGICFENTLGLAEKQAIRLYSLTTLIDDVDLLKTQVESIKKGFGFNSSIFSRNVQSPINFFGNVYIERKCSTLYEIRRLDSWCVPNCFLIYFKDCIYIKFFGETKWVEIVGFKLYKRDSIKEIGTSCYNRLLECLSIGFDVYLNVSNDWQINFHTFVNMTKRIVFLSGDIQKFEFFRLIGISPYSVKYNWYKKEDTMRTGNNESLFTFIHYLCNLKGLNFMKLFCDIMYLRYETDITFVQGLLFYVGGFTTLDEEQWLALNSCVDNIALISDIYPPSLPGGNRYTILTDSFILNALSMLSQVENVKELTSYEFASLKVRIKFFIYLRTQLLRVQCINVLYYCKDNMLIQLEWMCSQVIYGFLAWFYKFTKFDLRLDKPFSLFKLSAFTLPFDVMQETFSLYNMPYTLDLRYRDITKMLYSLKELLT